jgi:hypothetical protein
MDDSRLQVQHTLQRAEQKQWALIEPKTKSSRRGIQLPAIALEALRAHRERQLA